MVRRSKPNMDTSTVLEKYTQDLSNLPLEVRHLLDEIKSKDLLLAEAKKRYQSKENQIHKFAKSNGTLTKHPKEQQLASKIEEEMTSVMSIQREKIKLANTALFLISRHLFNFETDIARLERDEMLPKIELDADNKYDNGGVFGLNDSLSDAPSSRNGTATPDNGYTGSRRVQRRKQSMIKNLPQRLKRLKSEELDDSQFQSTGFLATGSLAFDSDMQDAANDGPMNQGDDADNKIYCFCQRVSFGEMIGCDNDDCKHEWFHWSCVGITSPPKENEIWYCPDCAPKMEKRKKKRKL